MINSGSKYRSQDSLAKAIGMTAGGLLMLGLAFAILHVSYTLSLIDDAAGEGGLDLSKIMVIGGLGAFGAGLVLRGAKGIHAAFR